MGNDALMLELFDTILEGCNMSGMKKVKKKKEIITYLYRLI